MTALDTTPTFDETTLTAGDLTLRPLTQSDADDVAEACQDPETLRWLPIPRPYTLANAQWFIGTFAPTQRELGRGIVFAIESAGRLVGVIDLKHVNWASRVAEGLLGGAVGSRSECRVARDTRACRMGHLRPRLRARRAVRRNRECRLAESR
jgi:hypothetical protein